MQKGKVAKSHVVKVDLHFGPVELGVIHREALRLVVDDGGTVNEARPVHAFPKLSSKQVDPHDAEDEPEDEADQQHVHDGGDGPNESVHHHLGGTRGSSSGTTTEGHLGRDAVLPLKDPTS